MPKQDFLSVIDLLDVVLRFWVNQSRVYVRLLVHHETVNLNVLRKKVAYLFARFTYAALVSEIHFIHFAIQMTVVFAKHVYQSRDLHVEV